MTGPLRSERLRVVVAGMVAGTPWQGGASWSVLQWVLGLREAGHDVLLVEEVPLEAIRPAGATLAGSENGSYFAELVRRFGLEGFACLVVRGSRETLGMPYRQLLAHAPTADCLINISGTVRDESLLGLVEPRIYLDVDPGFTQLWEHQGHDLGLARHSRFATLGLSIGGPGCPIPTGGREWVTTLPPVALSEWPAAAESPRRPFSSVINWRGYGSIVHGSVHYGQKAHSFRSLFPLPGLTGEEFSLACHIDPRERSDLHALEEHGWRLLDPHEAAGTPDRYRTFLSSSLAELNVAKSGYVQARCGWFSDRSACYLASGRPVVAQDTSLPDNLPVGEGFLTFRSLDEAAEAVREVRQDYPRHSKAARLLAEEMLDARAVIPGFLDKVLG